MKQLVILSILIFAGFLANGQNERKFVRKGNDIFMEAVKDTTKLDTANFRKAETEYRKALDKKPQDSQWNFNLGDAMYKQMKFKESTETFDQLANQFENPVEKARALHNKGNSLLFNQKIDESIKAYKEALRNNPSDIETKYNLAYAQNLKKQQEKQKQQQKKNQDKNKDQQNKDKQNQDQNQDKNNQDKQDQNKDQQQNKQNQDQQKNQQNQNQQKQQQQQQQNKISKENAEQLLQALQNDESKIQDKVKKAKAAKAKKITIEKDW